MRPFIYQRGGTLPCILLLASAVTLHAAPDLPDTALATFGRQPYLHGARIESAELSRDGTLLATVSRRSVTIWDTATGEPRQRFLSWSLG